MPSSAQGRHLIDLRNTFIKILAHFHPQVSCLYMCFFLLFWWLGSVVSCCILMCSTPSFTVSSSSLLFLHHFLSLLSVCRSGFSCGFWILLKFILFGLMFLPPVLTWSCRYSISLLTLESLSKTENYLHLKKMSQVTVQKLQLPWCFPCCKRCIYTTSTCT